MEVNFWGEELPLVRSQKTGKPNREGGRRKKKKEGRGRGRPDRVRGGEEEKKKKKKKRNGDSFGESFERGNMTIQEMEESHHDDRCVEEEELGDREREVK